MAKSSAAFSVLLRARLDNRPGVLGHLCTAIGDVGGNIRRLEGFHLEGDDAVLRQELVIDTSGEVNAKEVEAAAAAVDGVEVEECIDRTFLLHDGGKLETTSRIPLDDVDDLSMAYTPGVARICNAIAADPSRVNDLTIKGNTVAIVTDGTAVLGLGDIGPEASLPVMEGKALLFKNFAGVDAFPICLDVDSADELIETVMRLAPTFGGVNLEDIAAPGAFEIERRLDEALDIPVFHDDQHGTAVVVLAALRNALQIVGKDLGGISVAITGAGASGVAVAKMLHGAGVQDLTLFDRKGAIHGGRDDLNEAKAGLVQWTNPRGRTGGPSEGLAGTDVFIGLSGPGVISVDDVATMADDAIVFALANPDPEVDPIAVRAHAAVVATGRSDYPNQINNVLAFPGIFRGALDARSTRVSEGMKLAAAEAIAAAVPADALRPELIIPSPFDESVPRLVAEAVAAAAKAEGITRD